MTGFQAPECECGHKIGDHGTTVLPVAALLRGALSGGRCFIRGCGCMSFVDVTAGEEDRDAA